MYALATAKGPSNIAVIKYWGKRDAKRNTPINSSVSVTLDIDQLHTVTTVFASPSTSGDRLWLNRRCVPPRMRPARPRGPWQRRPERRRIVRRRPVPPPAHPRRAAAQRGGHCLKQAHVDGDSPHARARGAQGRGAPQRWLHCPGRRRRHLGHPRRLFQLVPHRCRPRVLGLGLRVPWFAAQSHDCPCPPGPPHATPLTGQCRRSPPHSEWPSRRRTTWAPTCPPSRGRAPAARAAPSTAASCGGTWAPATTAPTAGPCQCVLHACMCVTPLPQALIATPLVALPADRPR